MAHRVWKTTSLLAAVFGLSLVACQRQPDAAPPAAAAKPGKSEVAPPAPLVPPLPKGTPATTGEFTLPPGTDPVEATPAQLGLGPEHDTVKLEGIVYIESAKVEPYKAGCADGQREGFAEIDKFPTIAGCVGRGRGVGAMDDPKYGRSCGDDMPGECPRPSDVCAEGWHVCAHWDHGGRRELSARVSADECDAAGPGRFNAAISHAEDMEIDPCTTVDPRFPVGCMNYGRGSEPVCCGQHCESGACRDLVWKGRTRITRGMGMGCGRTFPKRSPGVLCCRDESVTQPKPHQ